MSLKLIVLSGLPASGKSTMSRELRDKLGYTIVARDSLRLDYPELDDEELSLVIVRQAGIIMAHSSVIIDDCNLCERDRTRWMTMAAAFDAELEWIQLETGIDVCIERDSKRTQPVGSKRIREMEKEK